MNHISRNKIIIPVLLSLIVIASFGVSFVQAGAPWEELRKIHAADGKAGELFGNSIAMSGNIAVIGAIGDDVNGESSGSAYIFNFTTGEQLFKLLPSDGAIGSIFGVSVAIDGRLAVIGAPGDLFHDPIPGAAYVFDVVTGRQLSKLVPFDGFNGNLFGCSVAISGNMALIGTPNDNDNGIDSGSAYLFNATTGDELLKLRAFDGSMFDRFGNSVALSGNLAIIGTPYDSDNNGFEAGSAYVFDISKGEMLYKLHAVDEHSNDHFGISVSISENMAVIGAPDGRGVVRGSGAAYVFNVTTGQELFKLLSLDGRAFDQFGSSVAISGKRVVVGAYGTDDTIDRSGSAYVFELLRGQPHYFKILPTDPAPRVFFGRYVAISGKNTMIGSDLDNDLGSASGAAYVFQQRYIADELTITPNPLKAGQIGTFSIFQMIPDKRTWLMYSMDGLEKTYIHQLNVVIDLVNARVASGRKRTDASGNLQITFTIPHVPNPRKVWFQAVQEQNTTNFVATQIVP